MKLIKISLIALLGLQATNILSSDLQKTAINAALFFGAYYGFNTMLTCIHEASHRSADILLRNAKEHKQIQLENFGLSAYSVTSLKNSEESNETFNKNEIINLSAGPLVAATFSFVTLLLSKSSIGQIISSAGIISELANLIPSQNPNADGSKIYKRAYDKDPTYKSTIVGRTLLATTFAGLFIYLQK